jgi:hypothetical protein
LKSEVGDVLSCSAKCLGEAEFNSEGLLNCSELLGCCSKGLGVGDVGSRGQGHIAMASQGVWGARSVQTHRI